MSPGGDGPRGGGGRRGEVRAWLAWWAILTALYVVLVDSRRLEELVAAAVVGALGATAAALVRREREVLLPASAGGGGRASHRAVVATRPRAARARARSPAAGRVLEVRFDAIGDDPHDAARRALAVAGRSLAPNTIVIGIDEELRVLIAHRLVDRGEPK
jgi:hypothetical protein